MLAVFVIDCAEPAILNDLVARGRMPLVASLAGRGATIPLKSDGDALDGSVFQTLLTGVNPGKHGIHKYRQLVAGTYNYELSKASHSPQPQVWRVLSDHGRRCCVFDVPKVFPFAGFNGSLVASWGAYSPAGDPASLPAHLYADVERRFGAHPLRLQRALPLEPAGYEDALQTLVGAVAQRADGCRWLLGQEPWDFFMTAFSESHVGAHQFWHLRDPRHPLYDAESARRSAEPVEQIYEAIDRALADLIGRLPPDSTVIVMTQQGVQHNYTGSHLLPAWLAMREGRTPRRSLLAGVDAALGSAIRNRIRLNMPEHVANRLARRKFPGHGAVFMLPGSEYGALLRVNLAGREPMGRVASSDYDRVLDALSEDLAALRNPGTGRTAVAEVKRTHRIYDGPLVNHLPDAIVCWQNDAPIEALDCPRYGRLQDGISFTDITHSMHTSEGMAFIAGPNVPGQHIGERRDIRDMTATMLELAGVPAPGHLEGAPVFRTSPAASTT